MVPSMIIPNGPEGHQRMTLNFWIQMMTYYVNILNLNFGSALNLNGA